MDIMGRLRKMSMVSEAAALPDNPEYLFDAPSTHAVLGTALKGPWPDGTEQMWFAGGCFWGVERLFWGLDGVVTTACGYAGGYTAFPTYEQVCTGQTGHAETVLVAYDPQRVSAEQLCKVFWENHDPTTKNRQGNDTGTAYRSMIFAGNDASLNAAESTRAAFGGVLAQHGHGSIVTEITRTDAHTFYYAEEHHQQYLHKNPGGYCNHGPHGMSCPVGLDTSSDKG